MSHHTVQSLIKDQSQYIKRAQAECNAFSKAQLRGFEPEDTATVVEHLSIALTCYDEITEQARMEINDLEEELSVAEAQLVRAMGKIPYSLWVANNVGRDELFKWLEEQEIDLFFDIDHFTYMTGLAFNDEESMMLVKVKYGDYVLPSHDLKVMPR